jgi:hypothetical protein
MTGTKNGVKKKLLDTLLEEASGRILHAMALSVTEAETEWLRAAVGEEELACLLEAEGRDREAAVHYVSAGSCYARVRQFVRAVALLRSALSFSLRDVYRREIEKLLKDWLPKAKKQLRGRARKQAAPRS